MARVRGNARTQGSKVNRKVLAAGSSTVLATVATGTALVLGHGVAGANAPIVVDSLTDDGTGTTLRDAIVLANGTPGQDEITFSVTGTITLSSHLQTIEDAVHITGPGAANLTIDGDGQWRVFQFAFLDSSMGTSAVTGLTVTDADGTDNNQGGPAVQKFYGSGDLLIEDVVFTDNYAQNNGGAINLYNTAGTVTINRAVITDNSTDGPGGALYIGATSGEITVVISNSVITGNHAADDGGALYSDGDTLDLVISDSVVSDNSADGDGGGLSVRAETFTLTGSTVDGNDSLYGNGGGIHTTVSGLTTISNTTISNNTAKYYGGGLAVEGETVFVQSTISGNTAGQAGAAYIGVQYGAAFLLSTVTDNEATNPGSGPAVHGLQVAGGPVLAGGLRATDDPIAAGTIQAIGSIIAGNGDLDLAAYPGYTAVVESLGSILGEFSTDVTVTDAGGSITGATGPQVALGPLADNGGPTKTHSLLPGSIAIDAGPAAADLPTFPGSEFDQRGTGFARVVGGSVDVGAFEVQIPPGPDPVPDPDSDLTPRFTG